MQRRLTAIFAADVVGYSRMIRADEEGTLVAVRDSREELIVNGGVETGHRAELKCAGLAG